MLLHNFKELFSISCKPKFYFWDAKVNASVRLIQKIGDNFFRPILAVLPFFPDRNLISFLTLQSTFRPKSGCKIKK